MEKSKKLVVMLGSPNPNSISEKVAMEFVKGAEEAGYTAKIYNIDNLNVKGCKGCGSCRKNDIDCVIDDDLKAYFKDLHSCDALLVTAPNYYSQIAGPMITFMNRHYCLNRADKTSRLESGKKLAGIFAQGAPEDYPKYPATYDWYLGTFASKGMENVGKIIVGGNSDLEKKCQEAYELGKSL